MAQDIIQHHTNNRALVPPGIGHETLQQLQIQGQGQVARQMIAVSSNIKIIIGPPSEVTRASCLIDLEALPKPS